MTEYRIRESGAVVTEFELRIIKEPTMLPEILGPKAQEENGVDAVLESPQPSITQYQSIYRDGVEQDAKGNWIKKWAVRDWTAEEIAVANHVPVPEEVSMASARIVLLRNGVTDAMVRSAISNSKMTDLEKGEALIAWEFRATVRRDSSLTQSLGVMLDLTEEQIDGMFVAAKDV